MTYLTIGLGIAIAAISGMVYLAAIAPLGYENEDGWHEGIEPLDDPKNWGDQ